MFLLGLGVAHAKDDEFLEDKFLLCLEVPQHDENRSIAELREEKIRDCTEYLNKYPDDEMALIMRSVVYFDQKRYDLAALDHEKVAVLQAADPSRQYRTYFFLGNIYASGNRHEKAKNAYRKAFAIESKITDELDDSDYKNRAVAYEALGEKTKAIANYRKALALNSKKGGYVFVREESLEGLKRLNAKP